VAEFHAANEGAARDWPARMLASSTHDTKRSEDVRARIALLSEMPDRWRVEVFAWRELSARHRTDLLDGNTEYLIYQTLVGTWPISVDRLWTYLEKAVREQKNFTTWTDPNEKYEAELRAFVESLVDDEELTARVGEFVESLAPAWQISALAQTLLKLTAVGVPDIYQGTELWDLSLVDPDNRRPVDYALRRKLLEHARTATAADALAGLDEGLAKMWLINRVLTARHAMPETFGIDAGYRGIAATGSRAEHVVAFSRGDEAIVVAPRLVSHLGWPHADWQDTALDLPSGGWRDVLSDVIVEGGSVQVADLLRAFPMALLISDRS
jgi:(1->4)-alpha-D-glucan 1-alpha-D-glucosylmutase